MCMHVCNMQCGAPNAECHITVSALMQPQFTFWSPTYRSLLAFNSHIKVLSHNSDSSDSSDTNSNRSFRSERVILQRFPHVVLAG